VIGDCYDNCTPLAIDPADLTQCLVPVVGSLVINEVDYDQAGTDAATFIEIYNGTGADVSLANLAVAYLNGNNNAEYGRAALAGAGATLASGGYLVVRNATVVVAPGALTVDVTGDFLQNGAPDGLALIDTATLTVIDVLSYEGSMTAAQITGFPATTNLVEGTAFAGVDTNDDVNSLARVPNGGDTNNAVVDWTVTTVKTPGAANSL
jgi:hypothetical protein